MELPSAWALVAKAAENMRAAAAASNNALPPPPAPLSARRTTRTRTRRAPPNNKSGSVARPRRNPPAARRPRRKPSSPTPAASSPQPPATPTPPRLPPGLGPLDPRFVRLPLVGPQRSLERRLRAAQPGTWLHTALVTSMPVQAARILTRHLPVERVQVSYRELAPSLRTSFVRRGAGARIALRAGHVVHDEPVDCGGGIGRIAGSPPDPASQASAGGAPP